MNDKVWTIALGLLMAGAGLAHFIVTKSYLPIVPRFLPQRTGIVIVSGMIEFLAGVGLFIPSMRTYAALIVLILMVAFLPLHTWDLFRQRPAVHPRWLTAVRWVLQFVLIFWSVKVWQIATHR